MVWNLPTLGSGWGMGWGEGIYEACTELQGLHADELGNPQDNPMSPFCRSVALRMSGLMSTELVR